MIKLEEKIKEVDNNYLNLLNFIKNSCAENNIFSALDSIRIFWYKNRKLVSLFLQTLKEREAFSYSGATYLDVDDKEYYGFLAVGKIHIMDDQLYKYADIAINGKNFEGIELIKTQIFQTVNDNIKILSNLKGIVLLLPVRLFFTKLENIYTIAEKCFLDLFENRFCSIKNFFDNCKSITDIDKAISENVKKTIFICDNDNFDISLEERIKLIPNNFMGERNDVSKFFFSIIGYLVSSLEIIENMHNYGIIPIIRNRATLSYVYILEQNNIDNNFNYLNKIIIAHEIFWIINQNTSVFEKYSPYEMDSFFRKKNLFDTIFKKFKLSERSIKDINFFEIKKTIKKIIGLK